MVDKLREDVWAGVRSLLGRKGVTAVAVASLAVAAAGNTTVFSLVQAVEFPRLIYPDAGRIVFLESKNETRGLLGMPVSAPDARDIAEASRRLHVASLAADQSSIVRTGSVSRRISGRRVEASFFQVLGTQARHGRVLTPDDRAGVIVVSDRLWQEVFAADPSIVGGTFRLDGGVVTVAGVMPLGSMPMRISGCRSIRRRRPRDATIDSS